ncbi:MAG: hypothetical protein Q8M01_16590 [Rubrivivax sp.]|nr:hypothetical protein [Rubrivivax sp.]
MPFCSSLLNTFTASGWAALGANSWQILERFDDTRSAQSLEDARRGKPAGGDVQGRPAAEGAAGDAGAVQADRPAEDQADLAQAPVAESFRTAGAALVWATQNKVQAKVEPAEVGGGFVLIPKVKPATAATLEADKAEIAKLNAALRKAGWLTAAGKPVQVKPATKQPTGFAQLATRRRLALRWPQKSRCSSLPRVHQMQNESPFRSAIEQMEEHEIIERLKKGMFSEEARPVAEAILRARGIDPANPVVPLDQRLKPAAEIRGSRGSRGYCLLSLQYSPVAWQVATSERPSLAPLAQALRPAPSHYSAGGLARSWRSRFANCTPRRSGSVLTSWL